jgi:hypothetical protein
MSLNTDKIIFKSEEEIRKYAESLAEEVLKIPEDHFGNKTTTYQDSIYYAIKVKGKEKFIDEEVERMLLQQELDPNINSETQHGIDDENEGPKKAYSTSGQDCKLFTVNFFYHEAFTPYPDADSVIDSLNVGYSDCEVNTSLYGDRKQLDTKFRFKKGLVVEIPNTGPTNGPYKKVWQCEDDPDGDEVHYLNSVILDGQNGLPDGLPRNSFNIYYAHHAATCNYGAFAYYAWSGYPMTGFQLFPTFSLLKSANYQHNTLVHELGHNFDLAHVFGHDPCGDDGVSDTPLQKASSNMTRHNLCGDGLSMNENHMDYAQAQGYSPDLFFFTEGQQARMNAAVALTLSEWYETCDCETFAVASPPPPPPPQPPGQHGGTGGPIDLPAATLIGYSSTGNYFGEDVSRWRTVQTVTIEGIMDPLNINAMIGNGSDIPASTNTYLGHNVSIDGYVVDRSRLISLEFVASDGSITEKHDHIAKFRATYEVYIPNTDSDVFEISFNNLQALEEFSEEINFSLDEDMVFSCNWTMSVKYADSTTGGGVSGVTAREAAQLLWTDITTKTPPSIPPTLNLSVTNVVNGVDGHIWSRGGKWYDTESYDAANGSATFSRTRKLSPQHWESSQSAIRKHSFEMSEAGIANVTEEGELDSVLEDTSSGLGWGGGAADARSKVVDMLNEGAGENQVGSYSRCNSLYTNYKSVLGTNTASLAAQYTKLSVGYDPDAGKINYSITYTDDPRTSTGHAFARFESTIYKEKESSPDGEEYSVYVEEGEWVGYWGGLVDKLVINNPVLAANGYLKDSAISTMAGSAGRINNAYPGAVGGAGCTAIPLSRKLSYSNAENKFNFTMKFSNEGAITNPRAMSHPSGVEILRLDVKYEDDHGVSKKEWFNPPNNPLFAEFVHVGNDVPELSTRKVTFSGRVDRAWSGANANALGVPNIQWYASRVRDQLTGQFYPLLKQECLSVFSEGTQVYPLKYWQNKFYFSDASLTLKSSMEFSISLEMKYLVPHGPTPPFTENSNDNLRIS